MKIPFESSGTRPHSKIWRYQNRKKSTLIRISQPFLLNSSWNPSSANVILKKKTTTTTKSNSMRYLSKARYKVYSRLVVILIFCLMVTQCLDCSSEQRSGRQQFISVAAFYLFVYTWNNLTRCRLLHKQLAYFQWDCIHGYTWCRPPYRMSSASSSAVRMLILAGHRSLWKDRCPWHHYFGQNKQKRDLKIHKCLLIPLIHVMIKNDNLG